MKNINKLLEFNSDKFFTGKDIRVTGDQPWVEYENGVPQPPKGTKYKCIILQDVTKYDEVTIGGNEGEALTVKVPGPKKEYKKLAKVKLNNPTCKIYGDYRNQLSVTAEDIIFEWF